MLKRRTLGVYHKNTSVARIARAMIRDDTLDRFPEKGYDLTTGSELVHITRDDLLKKSCVVAKSHNMIPSSFTRWWRQASIKIYGEARRWPGPTGKAHNLEQYNPLDISETYDIITDHNYNPSQILLDGWLLNRQMTRRERMAEEERALGRELEALFDEASGEDTSDLEHVQA